MKTKLLKETKIQLFGWFLFILCAIFFLASGIKNHDALTIIGSGIFLIACVVFILPLMHTYRQALSERKIKNRK